MNKLLTYTPELFPELDPEAEDEVRGRRRSRAPVSFRGKPKPSVPRLRPMPLPRLMPIVPPLWRPPRDTGWPDDNRRTDQTGSQGSGEPANTQPAEPPSEYVRWVQDSLNRALGLQLPIDGIMNRETRSAVRSFQERRGLPINGLVGPETEAALKSASSPAPAPDTAPKPEAEWEIPSSASCNGTSCKEGAMDYELGFEAEPFAGNRTFNEFEAEDNEALEEWQGETAQESPQRVRWIQESLNRILGLRLKVDGIMGPQTRSAIRSFQTTRGLGADGIVGPKTQAAMNAALGGIQIPPQANPPYTTPALLTPPADQGTQRTVYGWSQYKQRVEDLPADQKAILKGIGDAIIASYQPGRQPVRTVQVYGHADQDTPPNQQREQQMSDERAQQVTDWLKAYVGNSIARRIAWDTKGFSTTQLKAPPTTEENRRRNRRVEIWMPRTEGIQPTCPCKPGANGDFCKWLQMSLNRTLDVRLPIDGVFGIQTRSALRSFQTRKGLLPTENVDSPTMYALVGMGAPTPACQPGGYVGMNAGPWWQDQAALQTGLAAIIANRNGIKLRYLQPHVSAGFMYTAGMESWRGTADQKALANAYVTWQGKLKPQVSGSQTRRVQRLLELWEDLILGEGDPSSVNTYDNMVVTWGIGFAGGASLERLMANLFRKSCYAQDAFLSNGIGLTTDRRLVVVDENGGVVVEDRQTNPKQKRTADARLVIKNDRRLVSLFANIAQGVGFVDAKAAADVRQAVVDAEFETLQNIPTGQILDEMVQVWDRQAIAVAGHNIHAGGKPGKKVPLTWGTFKGLVDKTVRGVVATLGQFFGEAGINGSIWVADDDTFKRIMKLGRGWGRQALQGRGPYAIAYDGNKYEMLPPPPVLRGQVPLPPRGFQQQPWNPDFIYFKAKTCEKLKKPNSLECDIVADNLVTMAKSTYPRETNVSCNAYYLVPRVWATRR